MADSLNTHAFVLKQYDVGDYDRSILFFTYEAGKINAIAKGIRRARSRRSGLVLTGNLLKIQIVPYNDRYILQEVVLERSYSDFAQSTQLTGYLYHTLELLDVLLREEPQKFVFGLTDRFMMLMQSTPRHIYMRAFEVKLLKELGFLPYSDSMYFDQVSVERKKILYDLAEYSWEALVGYPFTAEDNQEIKNLLTGYIESITEKKLKSLSFFS